MTKPTFPNNFIPFVPCKDIGSLTTSEIIGMAWDDETSFDDIKSQSGLSESEVIKIMRRHLQPKSFRMWRKRVTGRSSKHRARILD